MIVWVIDWEAKTEQSRIMDLSPQAMDARDGKTDNALLCAFSNTNPTSQVLNYIF